MTIEEILQSVEKVGVETDYWFVRTDNGSLFDDFIEKNYIAIGWDYITLSDIYKTTEESVKNKIALNEKFDLSNRAGKTKATTIHNKIKAFVDLKKNDVVIIPSFNSDSLAFGQIIDDRPFEELSAKSFFKRRNVQWHRIKSMRDLDPVFYQVKSNQHAISNINPYASHIDRVIGNLFKKGERIHFVLNIEKTDDINFDDLRKLMDNIKVLTQRINSKFEFKENPDEFYIKVNLQSKGALELIKTSGKSLAVLAYLMFLVSCGNAEKEDNKDIRSLLEENDPLLQNTSNVMDSLKVDNTRFTKPFKN